MLWLYSIEGLGEKKIEMLLNICKTANGVYLLREDFIDELGFLTKRDKEALKAAKRNMDIQRNYEEMQKNPDDVLLQRQKYLLQNADICTIDSFCIKLVRENFEKSRKRY